MTPEDVAQWVGVSVGSNCVMLTILSEHNKFVYVLEAESEVVESAHMFMEAKTCVAWKGGIFAADRMTFNSSEKPGLYGDMLTDQKRNYSVNCQVGSTHTLSSCKADTIAAYCYGAQLDDHLLQFGPPREHP